jgi:predicted nucleic acid-binding protein
MARDLILVDTCVFIKAFRRDKNTLRIINDIKGITSYSVITKLELLVGASTSSRKEAVSNILSSYYGISLSPAI